jgi:type IV secretion system protein VirB9
MRIVYFLLCLMCLLTLPILDATAAKESQPVATDRRIRTVAYIPNEVYHFIGHYGYQSAIEFELGEEIQTISVGDSVAWQITPTENRIFLKPIAQSADTNMTVVTNRRLYFFELIGREADSMRDKDMIFIMRFIYPNSGGGNVTNLARDIPIPDVTLDRAKLNLNYTISGDDRIAPTRIFDDGRFTYFQFPKHLQDMPAFFLVDSKNNESLINYRIRGDYLVVERVGERFTLRNGVDLVCVYNEKIYRGSSSAPPNPPASSGW